MLPITITCGDLNGIGIECFVKAVPHLHQEIPLQLIAPTALLEQYLFSTGLPATHSHSELRINNKMIPVIDIPASGNMALGSLTASSGHIAVSALQKAIQLLGAQQTSAVVTMPVSKEANTLAGWQFPGQTEMFASKASGSEIMMLLSGTIRVALATVHTPLVSVPKELTQSRIIKRTKILHHALVQDFGITQPRIAVLGLNPHAGENGLLGTEEQTTIIPAIHACKQQSILVDGPFPADGFFAFGKYTHYDAILAMYHDQGLIPLKLLAKGAGVNVTLGLDIIRTSPDHGTAFEIAGKNLADPTSTIEAIELAYSIYKRRSS